MITRSAPAFRWSGRVGAAREPPGRLDDDLDAEVVPGQRRRGRARRAPRCAGRRPRGRVPSTADRHRQGAVGGVVAEQLRVDLRRGEVVDRHHLDVGVRAASTARRKLRPIRPKPLIPTRTVMALRLPRATGHAPRRRIPRRATSCHRTGAHPSRPASASASLPGSWTRPAGSVSTGSVHDRDPTPCRGPSRPRCRTAPGRPGPRGRPGRRDVAPHVVARGLGDLGPQVADEDPLGRARGDGLGHARHGGGGQHARVQRARADHDLVRAPDGVTATSGGRGGVARDERDRPDPARPGDGHLAGSTSPPSASAFSTTGSVVAGSTRPTAPRSRAAPRRPRPRGRRSPPPGRPG